MEFDRNELFKDGKFNPYCLVRFFSADPFYGMLMLDESSNAETLYEVYQEYKKGIDKFIGDELDFPTNEYELLRLADAIDSYIGLQT